MWLKHRVRIRSDARGIVADSHYVLSLRTYNRTQNYGVDPWSNNVHVCPASCGVHVPRSDSRGYSDAELSVRRETMDHRSRGVFRVFRVTLVSVLRQQSQTRDRKITERCRALPEGLMYTYSPIGYTGGGEVYRSQGQLPCRNPTVVYSPRSKLSLARKRKSNHQILEFNEHARCFLITCVVRSLIIVRPGQHGASSRRGAKTH